MSPQPDDRGTDDDELVDRLREALRSEADAVAPFSGRWRSIAALHERTQQRRAARRRMAVAALAAALVAAGVAVGINVSTPKPTQVGVAAPPLPTSKTPAAGPTQIAHPLRGSPSSTPAGPVSGGFDPLSVTYVTTSIGYVLGTVNCGDTRCLRLTGTLDAGASWTDLGQPQPAGAAVPDLGSSGPVELGVRFADQLHGWIFGQAGNDPILWATDDAGQTWQAQDLPTGVGVVSDLETADTQARAVLLEADPPSVQVLNSPMAPAHWVLPSLHLPEPAGDQPLPDLVVQRSGAWLAEQGAGARLDAGGVWQTWTPPCGSHLLAATTATHMVAVCAPNGSYGSSLEWSTDGGVTWSSANRTPAGLTVQQVAEADADEPVIAGTLSGRDVIEISQDAGSSWSVEWKGSGSASIDELGFEDRRQGVAIVVSDSGSELLMTHDGGQSWHPVDLQTSPGS